ncbi:MAG: hypothetical protein JWR73_1809, partial [Tardiphaga sp.]|nr:hypothetical protein [Tardiphaga sp.]
MDMLGLTASKEEFEMSMSAAQIADPIG